MRIHLEDSDVLRQQIEDLKQRLGVHTVPEVVRRCLAEVTKMTDQELGVPPTGCSPASSR